VTSRRPVRRDATTKEVDDLRRTFTTEEAFYDFLAVRDLITGSTDAEIRVEARAREIFAEGLAAHERKREREQREFAARVTA
jgi:hypothetical protein